MLIGDAMMGWDGLDSRPFDVVDPMALCQPSAVSSAGLDFNDSDTAYDIRTCAYC